MFDPILNETFESGTKESRDGQNNKWYVQNKQTEPIWATNQNAGNMRKSAASWIGSDVKFGDKKQAVSIPYDAKKPYNDLIDEFIGLLTVEDDPINFGAIYFDEPGIVLIMWKFRFSRET